VSMRTTASSNTGGSQHHENRSPFLAMNWIIALVGVYPSRN
jgi:microcystin-dependent protein